MSAAAERKEIEQEEKSVTAFWARGQDAGRNEILKAAAFLG